MLLTVKEHEISLQEAMHILNKLDFVEFSQKIVSVNVSGTKRVHRRAEQENVAGEPVVTNNAPGLDLGTVQATVENYATTYWKRENDRHYKRAMQDFQEGKMAINPASCSLYQFAAKYTLTWRPTGEMRVPHVVPNFRYIPKRTGAQKTRYSLFLRTILLVHKVGCKLSDVEDVEVSQLEEQVKDFLKNPSCPTLIKEEFEESQRIDEETGAEKQQSDTDNEAEDNSNNENNAEGEEELHVPQENPHEKLRQDAWMAMLGKIRDDDTGDYFDEDIDYDDTGILGGELPHNHDWSEDAAQLGLTAEDVEVLPKWVKHQQDSFNADDNMTDAPLNLCPAQLNKKQFWLLLLFET